MIALFKLITGEFVIGKKNDKDKVIEKPYLVIKTKNGIAMIEFFQGLAKGLNSVPYNCIIMDVEPSERVADSYKQILSPLSIPKKKLIDLSMHKNLN